MCIYSQSFLNYITQILTESRHPRAFLLFDVLFAKLIEPRSPELSGLRGTTRGDYYHFILEPWKIS